jgi:hypothetical protein
VVSWAVHLWPLVAVLVYTPPSGGAGAQRRAIEAALGRALGPALDADALGKAQRERASGWLPAGAFDFFQSARAQAEEGRRHLERVELEEAEAAFAEAERIYERELAWPAVAALWSEVALWRGVVAFERHQPDLAERLFRRAVALDPAARLTEASVRPDVVRAFRQANRARPSVRWMVHSVDGAEIRVDNQSPHSEVSAGEHVVVARAAGRLPIGVLVAVENPLLVELTPPPDRLLAALDGLGERPASAGLTALVRTRRLDGVLVAAAVFDRGQLTLVGTRVDEKGCSTAPVEVDGRKLEAAAAKLVDHLQKAAVRCPGSPEAVLSAPVIAHPRLALAHKTQPPDNKKPFWRRPWLWIGLAAVTTATVALGAALAPTATHYQATVDGSQFSTR